MPTEVDPVRWHHNTTVLIYRHVLDGAVHRGGDVQRLHRRLALAPTWELTIPDRQREKICTLPVRVQGPNFEHRECQTQQVKFRRRKRFEGDKQKDRCAELISLLTVGGTETCSRTEGMYH